METPRTDFLTFIKRYRLTGKPEILPGRPFEYYRNIPYLQYLWCQDVTKALKTKYESLARTHHQSVVFWNTRDSSRTLPMSVYIRLLNRDIETLEIVMLLAELHGVLPHFVRIRDYPHHRHYKGQEIVVLKIECDATDIKNVAQQEWRIDEK